MRMKYYIRGLGIGIILATLLMGIVMKSPDTMSDEEIKARAKELGMVEPKTLADVRDDVAPTPLKSPVEEDKTINTETPDATEIPTGTQPSNEDVWQDEDKKVEENKTPVEAEKLTAAEESTQVEGEVILFEIFKGESSDSICDRLQEMGIVNSAVRYNNYLCDMGYDRKLNIGMYQLKIGMTDEEITKIITKNR